MFWACVTFNGVGTVAFVDGNFNAKKYQAALQEILLQIVARYFPQRNYSFQDDYSPVHRARFVEE